VDGVVFVYQSQFVKFVSANCYTPLSAEI